MLGKLRVEFPSRSVGALEIALKVTGNCLKSARQLLKDEDVRAVRDAMASVPGWTMNWSMSQSKWYYDSKEEGRQYWRGSDCPVGWASRLDSNKREDGKTTKLYFHINAPQELRTSPPSPQPLASKSLPPPPQTSTSLKKKKKRKAEAEAGEELEEEEELEDLESYRDSEASLVLPPLPFSSIPPSGAIITGPLRAYIRGGTGTIALTAEEARRTGLRTREIVDELCNAVERGELRFPFKRHYMSGKVHTMFDNLRRFLAKRFPSGKAGKPEERRKEMFLDEPFRPYKVRMRCNGDDDDLGRGKRKSGVLSNSQQKTGWSDHRHRRGHSFFATTHSSSPSSSSSSFSKPPPFFHFSFGKKGAFALHVSPAADYWEMDMLTDTFSEHERLRARRVYQPQSVLEAFQDRKDRSFRRAVFESAFRYRPKAREEEEWEAADWASKTLSQVSPPSQNGGGRGGRGISPYLDGGLNSFMIRESVYGEMAECTQFKLTLASGVYKLLGAKRVLDISAGWGDRLLSALACDLERYVATDPNANLKPCHDSIIQTFKDKCRTDAQIIYEPFETAQLPEGETFDTVFTSPPFFNFEVYVDDKRDEELAKKQSISKIGDSFDDWMTMWLFPALSKAWERLSDNGHMAIHITDVDRCKVCEPMCLFVQSRLSCAEYVGCIGSSGAARKARPIWVFRKTAVDNRMATRGMQSRRAEDADGYLRMYFPTVHSAVTRTFGRFSSAGAGHTKEGRGYEDAFKQNKKRRHNNNKRSPRRRNQKQPDHSDPDYTSTTILRFKGMPGKYGPFFDLPGTEIQKRALEAHSEGEVSRVLATLNPDMKIIDAKTKTVDGRSITVHVFRDDFLPGGTKQRALGLLLLASKAKAHLYAGPENGFAQVALSHASRLCNKQAVSMVATPRRGAQKHSSVKRAEEFGAKLVEIPPPNRLKEIKREATRYCEQRPETLLLPFGLDCEAFVGCLEYALRHSLPKELVENGPRRLWLVAGSAVLLATFHRLWPKTQFMVVQVGKRIWPDQLEGKNATKFEAKEKFSDPSEEPPPYPSVNTYDAKLWQFVRRYGEDGDYIWNVACDPKE
mmetsp:Transcript_12506/g.30793  ORF Transcript_12506/g.30793 Transcript_12506/m.30793 type:complete len:1078 (-) Transcript_12506:102-3335(-)